MEDENVSSPAEGVTPDDIETIEAGQAEDGAEEFGTETLEADDGDAPSDEGDEGDADPEGDDASESEGEEGNESEEIELNFGGEKFSVPKGASVEEIMPKLSEFAHNLEAGYTKKFQDVAETRKSVEAEKAAVKRVQELQGDALTKFSSGLQLQREIAQLQQVDVSALWQSNPDQARQVSDTLAKKQAELQNTVAEVSRAEAGASRAQTEETARRFEEGKQMIERKVPGFTKDLPAVIEYAAKTLGVDAKAAEAEWALNPPMALAVHKAMLFDRMQAQAKQSSKPAPKTAKPIGKATGRGGTPIGNLSDPAQMAKYLSQ